jgi:hypothetical protein
MASTSSDQADQDPREERLYTQTFWSPSMATERRMLTKTLFLPLLYTALLMWACLSLFWGSLTTNNNLSKLTAVLVNLEAPDGMLGNAVEVAISNATNSLDWRIENDGIPDLAERLVLNEDVWAAVEGMNSLSLANILSTDLTASSLSERHLLPNQRSHIRRSHLQPI